MPRQKTEPFVWRTSTGLMHQWMLREYMRWLFPQLGASYEPPLSVRDFTATARPLHQGKKQEPFRPGKATGPLFTADLKRFATYCFDALTPESERHPYQIRSTSALVFIPEFKRLHRHLTFLIAKARQREQTT